MSGIKYSNPPLSYRHATTDHRSENKEFFRLLAMVAVLVTAILFSLDRAAAHLAPRMPFDWEMALAQKTGLDTLPVKLATAGGSRSVTPERAALIEQALQQRIGVIVKALNLPAEIQITGHFVDSPTVNAVATLGGHVTVFGGLLKELEFAEELDAVLAHEIGHVRHRHMVKQLSRGLAVAAGLGAIGVHSQSLNHWLLGDVQRLQQLSHSRDAEREADEVAVAALQKIHGNAMGMARLLQRFHDLQEKAGDGSRIEILQTHPHPQNRIRDAMGEVSLPIPSLTPLPPVFTLSGHPGGA